MLLDLAYRFDGDCDLQVWDREMKVFCKSLQPDIDWVVDEGRMIIITLEGVREDWIVL